MLKTYKFLFIYIYITKYIIKNNFIYYKYIYNIIGVQISIYTNKLFFIMYLVIYVYIYVYVYITVNILFKLILIGIVLESKYIYNTYM